MVDIKALVARGHSTFEGVPRDGLAYELAGALEAQKAVVEAAQLYTKRYDEVMEQPRGKHKEDLWDEVAQAIEALRMAVKALARPGVVKALEEKKDES